MGASPITLTAAIHAPPNAVAAVATRLLDTVDFNLAI